MYIYKLVIFLHFEVNFAILSSNMLFLNSLSGGCPFLRQLVAGCVVLCGTVWHCVALCGTVAGWLGRKRPSIAFPMAQELTRL